MKKLLCILCSLLIVLFAATGFAAGREKRVVLGIERIDEPFAKQLLAGKRLGLFTNQSGVDSKLRSSVALLQEKYNLTALFVPEHGLFGAVAAGETFASHSYKNIPVHSLYGATRRPTPEMLAQIDAMVVDIQDVGIRHYTYFSSLAYIMEECAKEKKQVIVLDRPNPLGGTIQGPVLKPEFKSFIGLYELPLRHGLTIGEFARFINSTQHIDCDLKVIPMKGWHRRQLWQDTGLPWVQTSPLIPTAETALLYGVTGVCGDSNLSVGVGTAKPFYFVGAPFADADAVKASLDARKLAGVAFRAARFTPRYGAYQGELVQGVEIYLTDVRSVNLPELDYSLFSTFKRLYPEQVKTPERGYGSKGYKLDIALGESSLREGEAPKTAFARWHQECSAFAQQVKPYLLYK
ncbi:exo-beta-N-acetylmuramidase NamZ family protein [Phascolarctobacterium succinatutens]